MVYSGGLRGPLFPSGFAGETGIILPLLAAWYNAEIMAQISKAVKEFDVLPNESLILEKNIDPTEKIFTLHIGGYNFAGVLEHHLAAKDFEKVDACLGFLEDVFEALANKENGGKELVSKILAMQSAGGPRNVGKTLFQVLSEAMLAPKNETTKKTEDSHGKLQDEDRTSSLKNNIAIKLQHISDLTSQKKIQ